MAADRAGILVVGPSSPEGVPTQEMADALALACRLGGNTRRSVAAVLTGVRPEGAEVRVPEGVHRLRWVSGGSGQVELDMVARALARLAQSESVDLVLMPHSIETSDLAPRLASLLDAPCATGCTTFAADGDAWGWTRQLHGGALEGTFECPHTAGTLIATIVPDTGTKACEWKHVHAEMLDTEPTDSRLWRTEVDIREATRAPLEHAARIIAGGRGIGGPDGFDRLRALADALDARIAASRPPCDLGWVPSTCQVGITGKQVAPELYVAVGISGSVQHLAGMMRSGCIVAINSDPDAAIFRHAQVGVVGDWHEVVAGMLDVLGADAETVAAGT